MAMVVVEAPEDVEVGEQQNRCGFSGKQTETEGFRERERKKEKGGSVFLGGI